MEKEKLLKSDVANLTSIARDERKSISERMDALNRISKSSYFHDRKQKTSLIRRVIERVAHLL